ncbi:MAG: hypothetical protein EBS55_12005, partial [Flavobacteriaceae bacterium]|nr:hypothetical protein [Flavobacteriaceae bacterium]
MITLNTIVYEGNFEKFLNENCWFFRFTSKYITKKIITVNNLNSKETFESKISYLKKIFDFEVYFVDDFLDVTKKFFKLNISLTDTGYYYTIPYFVSLINTETDYFFNVATDCMDDIQISDDFFEKSFVELNENDLCSTTMVSWCKNNEITQDPYSPHFGITIGEYEESESEKKLNTNFLKSQNFEFESENVPVELRRMFAIARYYIYSLQECLDNPVHSDILAELYGVKIDGKQRCMQIIEKIEKSYELNGQWMNNSLKILEKHPSFSYYSSTGYVSINQLL